MNMNPNQNTLHNNIIKKDYIISLCCHSNNQIKTIYPPFHQQYVVKLIKDP